jgi:heme/copper-type cytochrome/quinol oxidase subunit 2
MNSFWVPQLGGQEYTMAGMAMRLWLQADQPGNYFGTGANFSGKGFAHMRFNVKAVPTSEFNSWASQIQKTAPVLSQDGYNQLVAQGVMQQASFSNYPAGIFENTVMHEGGMYMKHDISKHQYPSS